MKRCGRRIVWNKFALDAPDTCGRPSSRNHHAVFAITLMQADWNAKAETEGSIVFMMFLFALHHSQSSLPRW